MRAALALALLAAAAAPAHAKRVCMTGPMPAQPIAGPDNETAGSGGVIVASGSAMPDWRFRDMNRIVRPEVVTVAPGLAIYHPPPLPGTDVILEQSDHTIIAHRTRALKIDAPSGPPEIESIVAAPMQGNRRMVTARLARSAPPRALIVVVSRVAGDKTEPLAWAMISAGARGAVGDRHRLCRGVARGLGHGGDEEVRVGLQGAAGCA